MSINAIQFYKGDGLNDLFKQHAAEKQCLSTLFELRRVQGLRRVCIKQYARSRQQSGVVCLIATEEEKSIRMKDESGHFHSKKNNFIKL